MQYVPMLASYSAPAAQSVWREMTGGAPRPRLRGSAYPRRSYKRKSGKPLKFRKSTKKKTIKSISKEVQEVKRVLKTSQTTLTHRYRDTGNLTVDNNQSSHNDIEINNLTRMLNTLQSCPVVDTASPSSVLEVNLASGSYQREVLFKKIYAHLKLRNNALTPVKVRVYTCALKKDTEFSPRATVYEGLEDIMSTAQIFSAHVYPSDSFLFKDSWRVVQTKSKTLQPGKEMDCYSVVENVVWDQSVVENQNEAYQTNLSPRVFLVRLEGVIAHNDGVATQVGALKGSVDYHLDTTHELHYDGGPGGINRLKITDNSSALVPGTVGMQPCSCMEVYADNHGDRIAASAINFQSTTLQNIQNVLEDLSSQILACICDTDSEEKEEDP